MTDPQGTTIDGTAEEVGTELVPIAPVSLFQTNDPTEVIEQATRVANALKGVVASRGLIASIKGKEHPKVEAWQLLGSMLGVHPVPVGEPRALPWPDPVPAALKSFCDRGLTFGFVASYTATKGGEIVGGGQARCVRTESTWKDRDDFALASMAQTRAISKTLSGPLRFVMELAGYSGTPAEEMPREQPQQAAPQPTANGAKKLSAANRQKVLDGIAEAEQPLPLVLAACGVADPEELTVAHANQIRDLLDKAA